MASFDPTETIRQRFDFVRPDPSLSMDHFVQSLEDILDQSEAKEEQDPSTLLGTLTVSPAHPFLFQVSDLEYTNDPCVQYIRGTRDYHFRQDKFQKNKLLSKGANGTVYLCTNSKGERMIVKELIDSKQDDKKSDNLLYEWLHGRVINHFRSYFPIFPLTYEFMIENNGAEVIDNWLNTNLSDLNSVTWNTIQKLLAVDPNQFQLSIQYCPNIIVSSKEFSNQCGYLKKPPSPIDIQSQNDVTLQNNVICKILRALWFGYKCLNELKDIFKHHDNHNGNFQIIRLTHPIKVEWKCSSEHKTFILHYLPVVIDFGRVTLLHDPYSHFHKTRFSSFDFFHMRYSTMKDTPDKHLGLSSILNLSLPSLSSFTLFYDALMHRTNNNKLIGNNNLIGIPVLTELQKLMDQYHVIVNPLKRKNPLPIADPLTQTYLYDQMMPIHVDRHMPYLTLDRDRRKVFYRNHADDNMHPPRVYTGPKESNIVHIPKGTDTVDMSFGYAPSITEDTLISIQTLQKMNQEWGVLL